VGRPVSELSDGERQKIMIARALAQEPDLMLLDEPTAYLDLPRRVEMMGLLRRLAHETGRAILLSTHDLDLALRSADRIWLLPNDGPMQTGAPEDLVLNGAFEAAFHSEGVAFDPRAGSFAVHAGHRGSIALEADGLRREWTQRALERVGFSISTNGTKPLARVVAHDDHWDVIREGEAVVCRSLYELVGEMDR
jgi:iron complex transport system ATP-binding protein